MDSLVDSDDDSSSVGEACEGDVPVCDDCVVLGLVSAAGFSPSAVVPQAVRVRASRAQVVRV